MARFVNRKVIMDSRKYTVEYIPEFADCDKKYDIKPQVLLAWCAELAGNHLRSRNITREQMWKDGQVFLLTRAAVHFEKVPQYNNKLYMTTWEGGTKGSQFTRKFAVKDTDGNILCDVDTMWALVNPHSHKICRPSEYIYEQIPCEDEVEAKVIKFKAEAPEKIKDYTFVYSDIDANGHVNNGVYLRLMSDIIPQELIDKYLKTLRINFIHECRQGETVGLYLEINDKICTAEGRFPDGKVSFEAQAEFV